MVGKFGHSTSYVRLFVVVLAFAQGGALELNRHRWIHLLIIHSCHPLSCSPLYPEIVRIAPIQLIIEIASLQWSTRKKHILKFELDCGRDLSTRLNCKLASLHELRTIEALCKRAVREHRTV
jgi:hypothetical protein